MNCPPEIQAEIHRIENSKRRIDQSWEKVCEYYSNRILDLEDYNEFCWNCLAGLQNGDMKADACISAIMRYKLAGNTDV